MVEAATVAVGALALQDRPDGLVGTLIQLGVLAVVFGGPILKGILDERRKQAGQVPSRVPPPPKRRARDAAGPVGDLERAGQDLWKQLLDGIESHESSTTAEATPGARPEPPAHTPSTRTARRRPEDPFLEPERDVRSKARRQSEERARRRPARKRLASALPSGDIPSESELEAGRHEEARLEQIGGDARRPSAPLADLTGFSGVSAGGDGVLGGTLGTLGDVVAPDPMAPKPPRPRVGLDRVSLRRAVLMAEILGPPVALRRPGQLDPPGLG